MEIADDRQLVQLASRRADPLFPVLARADALLPLLLILAVLPGLYAIEWRTLDDRAAVWGLRSLEYLSPGDIGGAEEAGGGESSQLLKHQPPLGNWLIALTMQVLGSSHPVSLVLVSYLATAGLVMVSFWLFRRLVGPRFAFWVSAVLACHGPLLQQAQTPAPQSLSILAALLTFWGFVGHRQQADGLVSWRLIVAGLALGMTLLAGGPLALVVVAILLLHVLGLRGEGIARSSRSSRRRRTWVGWPALKSLLVLGITALLIGGWWFARMSWVGGTQFWSGWLTGSVPIAVIDQVASESESTPAFSTVVLHRITLLENGLLGLSLLGLWRGCRELYETTDETRRRRLQLFVAWTGCAAVVWMAALRNPVVAPHIVGLWHGFLLIPLVAFAAFAVDEIAQRKIPMPVAVGSVFLSIAAMIYTSPIFDARVEQLVTRIWIVWMFVALFAMLIWGLLAYSRNSEHRQRLVLSGLIIGIVFANAFSGLHLVRATNDSDRILRAFRDDLSSISDVGACALVTDGAVPPRLRFLLRSLWPQAHFTKSSSWDVPIAQALSGIPNESLRTHKVVVIDWSNQQAGSALPSAVGVNVAQRPRPQMFKGRQLRAYELTKRLNGT